MALALAVTLSAQAEEHNRAFAKQEKSAIASSDKMHHQDLGKGLLPRAMPAMARLEGVLFMARASQVCVVKPAEGYRTAVSERTIQRVPKVHES